ncbi:MAG: hypothetical protein ACRCYA_08400 [Cetobacterium sp.]
MYLTVDVKLNEILPLVSILPSATSLFVTTDFMCAGTEGINSGLFIV